MGSIKGPGDRNFRDHFRRRVPWAVGKDDYPETEVDYEDRWFSVKVSVRSPDDRSRPQTFAAGYLV